MMRKWKVLVADDEPVILAGIRKFVEQSAIGCDVIGEAVDGAEALRLLRKLRPDIVISDIQMPKGTGLDMIKEARKENLAVQFIFISGYQEFEYVKEALRYDAVDYLLKPVGRKELDKAIEKAACQLADQSAINVLKDKKSPLQSFFEKINQENDYSEEENYHRFQDWGIEEQEGNWFQGIAFLMNAQETGERGYAQLELMRFVIYDKIQQALEKDKKGFLTMKDESGCHFMLSAHTQQLLGETCDQMIQMKEQLEEEYAVELYTGIGEAVEGSRNLVHAYKTAQFALSLYYFENRNVIIYSHIHKDFDCSFEEYYIAEDELLKAIVLHQDDYRTKCLKVLDMIYNLHFGNRNAAKNRMFMLLENIYTKMAEYHFSTDEDQSKMETLGRKIEGGYNFEEAKQAVLKYIDYFYQRGLECSANRDRAEMIRVKEYIREHYAEDISLNALADMAGMTPQYLSALFKRDIGKNYMAYLTEVRMDEAHKLLMGTNMMTYEIAERVGYRTVRRFVETFKKKYGTSPMEYKKQHKI